MRSATAYLGLCVVVLAALGWGAARGENQDDAAAKQGKTLTFQQMSFEPIVLDKSTDITLREDDQVFPFPEGSSRFAAAKLPQAGGPISISFRSFGGSGPITAVGVLVPRFAFLDENKQLIGTAIADEIFRATDFWRGNFFQGRVPLPAPTAYVVIYAAEKTNQPLTVGAANSPMPVPLSPLGKTEITATADRFALVSDSGVAEGRTRAQLFVVAEINGERIANAITESAKMSHGKGFDLSAVFPSREVPAKPLRVTLIATHHTGAPIQSVFSSLRGNFLTVKGQVEFTPVAGQSYVVKGRLVKGDSAVWIEEKTSGRIVTDKVVSAD